MYHYSLELNKDNYKIINDNNWKTSNKIIDHDNPTELQLKNRKKALKSLKNKLKNKAKYYSNVEMFRHIGSQRFLELPENIGCHLEALNTPYGSSERKYLKRWNS